MVVNINTVSGQKQVASRQLLAISLELETARCQERNGKSVTKNKVCGGQEK
jgi:hypothetical protein